MKKLWLLRPRDDLPAEVNLWLPWYDKCHGMVIRAENEKAARAKAVENINDKMTCESDECWLNAELSTCTELAADGPVEIIISDVHRA